MVPSDATRTSIKQALLDTGALGPREPDAKVSLYSLPPRPTPAGEPPALPLLGEAEGSECLGRARSAPAQLARVDSVSRPPPLPSRASPTTSVAPASSPPRPARPPEDAETLQTRSLLTASLEAYSATRAEKETEETSASVTVPLREGPGDVGQGADSPTAAVEEREKASRGRAGTSPASAFSFHLSNWEIPVGDEEESLPWHRKQVSVRAQLIRVAQVRRSP